MSELFLASAFAITGLMFAVWLISVPLKNASIIDLVWGLGFVVVAWVCFVHVGQSSPRRILLLVMTTVWGLRLSVYLSWRNIGKGEDYRYVAMRERHGSIFWIRSLLTVFILQGIIMWVVSLPIQSGMHNAELTSPHWLDVVGVLVFAIGLFFETVGDWQLARFKSNPLNKGQVMDSGLWRFTRHPNYFGDFMVWWGMYLVSVASGAGYWSVIGPLAMSFFLIRVSGVAMLEKSLKSSKAGFAEYQRRTNAFFPWFPKT